MESAVVYLLGVGGGLMLLILLRKPLSFLLKLVLRGVLGLGVLAVFNFVGGWIGLSLPLNPVTGLACGVLGVPGLATLLLLQTVAL
ncbi:MAG: pro-sigmaK processing inhibitor BofA family protein [Clostridia bacterium]|nr:pro-sigmaK processing inhibitor BofA family protein [Clostridia bacterium]